MKMDSMRRLKMLPAVSKDEVERLTKSGPVRSIDPSTMDPPREILKGLDLQRAIVSQRIRRAPRHYWKIGFFRGIAAQRYPLSAKQCDCFLEFLGRQKLRDEKKSKSVDRGMSPKKSNAPALRRESCG